MHDVEMKTYTPKYDTKDRVCQFYQTHIDFIRREADRKERYLTDLRNTDERTAVLAHRHDVNHVEIEGETRTLRTLAAETGMDLDMLESLYNRPDDIKGFQEWLGLAFTLAPEHVGAAHYSQINTDEGCSHTCHAHNGKFYRYNGRFEDWLGEVWYVNTIDPNHELDVWARGF